MRFPKTEEVKNAVREGIKDFSLVCENSPPWNVIPAAYQALKYLKTKIGK